ncbi:Alpha-(1,3)-fucosyltransferase 11 [Haplosporangium sp. Z 27]|nr:Alpha-(1,3)-fucosyltransferase 11 [Haplosporangium sp. Z 27]
MAERPQPQQLQEKYASLFAYKFTYHFNSDFIGSYFTAGHEIPTAFINLVSRPPLHTLQEKNNFRKSGFHKLDTKPLAPIAWIVSNCNAISGRHFMVNQLYKYIDVDIYGRCIPNRAWPKKEDGITDMSDEELVSHYKFYLAIENVNCEDYVTEKLERTFAAGTVPVVDGPQDYSRFTPGAKSIIQYDEFESPEQLAIYLKKLDQDDLLYNEYLSFRSERTAENTDEAGRVLINSPETFNMNYKQRLLPWFVDNWDLESGSKNRTTTEWLSKSGGWNKSREKYRMQWGPDGPGARCALCRVAHDLAEGITLPTKRLAIDTTCTHRKFYHTSWIVAFYPYQTLFLLVFSITVVYLILYNIRVRTFVRRTTMAIYNRLSNK